MKSFSQLRRFFLTVLAVACTGISFSQNLDSLIIETIEEDLAHSQNAVVLPEPVVYDTVGVSKTSFVDSLICYAESYLGTPYSYGSKGPNYFDCSGFTGYVFSHFGISLPSSSTAQYVGAPQKIANDSVQQGDLIFFMGRNGRKSVGHVGLVVDVDSANKIVRFIHAATHGGVILTNYPSTAYYNQRFMGYGRYPMPDLIDRVDLKRKSYSETIDTIFNGDEANSVAP
ncbi:MAG: C40 family peptidase [Bacteroidales bacterium]|nr:C40 family peptidase [Bacteroidales bacterium]